MTTGRNALAGDGQSASAPKRLGFTQREHIVALMIFALVTLLFFAPLVRGDTFFDIAGRQQQVFPWAGVPQSKKFEVIHYDQDDTAYPWQVFIDRALADGDFPFWDPYSFGGTPFFANGTNGVLYPPRLALTLAVSPARVHDLLLATHLFLAGAAMFLLLGLARLSFSAALVGGLAWMLNSFALAWQALEHYIAIEVWLPVGVLLVHATVRRRSWRAACGLGLAVAILFSGGNVLFVELAVVAIVGYAIALLFESFRRDGREVIGGAARLAAAALLSLGLTAVIVIPSLSLAHVTPRASLSYDQLGEFAMSWGTLAKVFTAPGSEPYHHDLFAGAAVGVLALVGLFRRQILARYATVLGVVTVLFMLHTPVTVVVDHVLPGFSTFKPLARAAFLLQFALAILAAYGFETTSNLLRTTRNRPSSRSNRLLSRMPPGTSIAAGVLAIAVAGSIVGQEWLWADKVMRHQPGSERYLYPRTPLIRYLERHPSPRFLPTYPAFRGSTAMISALPSAGGYESLVPERIVNFWRVVGDGVLPDESALRPLLYAYHPGFELSKLRPALLARAGVASVVAPPGDAATAAVPPGLELRYSRSDGRVFAVENALPRAYVAGRCEATSAPLKALQRFVAPDFAATGTVILERSSLREAGLSCAGGSAGRAGSASVSHSSLDSLTVDVAAQRSAWLVVTDSWDRGWSATVDGRSAAVLPADYALRAVRIPAGAHTVRFRYRPSSFRLGLVVSGVTVGVTLFAFAFAFGRRRRKAPAGPSAG